MARRTPEGRVEPEWQAAPPVVGNVYRAEGRSVVMLYADAE
jgi:hypothetical protein